MTNNNNKKRCVISISKNTVDYIMENNYILEVITDIKGSRCEIFQINLTQQST